MPDEEVKYNTAICRGKISQLQCGLHFLDIVQRNRFDPIPAKPRRYILGKLHLVRGLDLGGEQSKLPPSRSTVRQM